MIYLKPLKLHQCESVASSKANVSMLASHSSLSHLNTSSLSSHCLATATTTLLACQQQLSKQANERSSRSRHGAATATQHIKIAVYACMALTSTV